MSEFKVGDWVKNFGAGIGRVIEVYGNKDEDGDALITWFNTIEEREREHLYSGITKVYPKFDKFEDLFMDRPKFEWKKGVFGKLNADVFIFGKGDIVQVEMVLAESLIVSKKMGARTVMVEILNNEVDWMFSKIARVVPCPSGT